MANRASRRRGWKLELKNHERIASRVSRAIYIERYVSLF